MEFDLALLARQFLCCTPINKLILSNLPEHEYGQIDWFMQKEILDSTLNCALIKQYPIKKSYQKAFLKLFIEKLEQCNIEVNDNLYTMYCDLVSSSDDEPVHYRHFLINDKGPSDYITLQESTNIISNGTTGLTSWQGALALSEWCAKHKAELSGRAILELGCGVGLAGLNVINTCLPKRYIFSDCHHSVLNMVCKNIQLNLVDNDEKVRGRMQTLSPRLKLAVEHGCTLVDVIELKWEDIEDYMNEDWPAVDVIIGADILYESRSFNALAVALQSLLVPKNTYAIIAATVRNEDTLSQFLKCLGGYNLAFQKHPAPKQNVSIQLSDAEVRILKIFNEK